MIIELKAKPVDPTPLRRERELIFINGVEVGYIEPSKFIDGRFVAVVNVETKMGKCTGIGVSGSEEYAVKEALVDLRGQANAVLAFLESIEGEE